MSGQVTGAVALWLLVALPVVVGAVLTPCRADRVAAPISVATAAVLVLLAVVTAVTRPAVSTPFLAGAPLAFAVDALSALIVPAVAVVTLLVLVFAAADASLSHGRFHGLMLIFAAAAAATATATTLPALLVAWEVMGATSAALIGYWWRDRRRVAAGATAFLTTRTADLGLYLAAAAALAGGAGLAISDLPGLDGVGLHVAAAGVLVAAWGKAAQLPSSFWLRHAMAGPSPVSALLHSAAMVAMGGYLLLRTAELLAASGWADVATAWVGAVTALLLSAVAITQRDIKQLLAASTCAQLGFVVLAAGLSATAAGAAHLVAHAATKALLFLAAGWWLSTVGTTRLTGLRGAARRWPVVGACATVGGLALAGVPPLSLWATKSEVLAAPRGAAPAVFVVGLVAAALSAGYAGKLLVIVLGRVTDRPAGPRVPTPTQGVLVVLAVGAAVLGLLALPPVGDRVRVALGEDGAATAGAGELVGSALLALVVVAAVRLWRPPEPSWLMSWLGLDTAARVLVVRPVLAAATALARFDDRVVARAATAVARTGLTLGRIAARTDRDRVHRAVEHLARGVLRLAAVARRPQSGRLHRYLFQAAAVLALGVLLLVVVS